MPDLPPKTGQQNPGATVIPIKQFSNPFSSAPSFDPMLTIQLIANWEADCPAVINCSMEEKIKAIYPDMVESDLEFAAKSVSDLLDLLKDHSHHLLGGLSPHQFHLLAEGDWLPDNPGLQLCYKLTTEEVKSVPIIGKVKIFLETLGNGGTKATTAGNLNRNFVRSMIEQGVCDNPIFYKVVNESVVPQLRSLREVLVIAEIIEITDSYFRITDMGRELMEPDSEVGLFLMLFLAWFREFNFGNCGDALDLSIFQKTIGYSLYRLSILGSEWLERETMRQQLMPPVVTENYPVLPFDFVSAFLETCFLRTLEMFGLVEFQLEGESEDRWFNNSVLAFRKTPLFDRFIGVEFS